MREVDPITHWLAMMLLYLVLAVAGVSQLPKIAEVIKERLIQAVSVPQKVKVSL